ncbi:hypothetical protein NCS52_00786200 [Fusarium sp. LHS14.1]|nr:hypothetical protein NCS52_00786200 [Fusarium sp. LHS14.1]
MVEFACVDPERGRYPKQPYVEMADGEFRMDSEYARFKPPSKVKIGSSGMTDNWGRYFRAGREWIVWGHTLDEAERKIWKRFAGNLSFTSSTSLPGNNRLAKQRGPSEGAWALWTLLKVVYGRGEMMGKSVAITVQKRLCQIWEADSEENSASHTARKNPDKGKKPAQTKKGKTDANARQSRQFRQSTDDQTQFLNGLRTTFAGATVEKLLVEKLVKDNVHLTDANRILGSDVSNIQ